ncbi:hypothetical protein [Aliivibrio logei]|uniref:hypothetical protein n=1 Tax=Aliivibrio logei TaxID=688 RepID=UPI0035C8D7CA
MKLLWIPFSLFLFGCSEQPQLRPDIHQAVSVALENNAADFDVAYTDLNNDGLEDAVVMLKGMNWCGSGGCSMLVFQNTGSDFALTSKSTVIGTPIRVTETKKNGWNNLIVWSKGKGNVLMTFDGKSYPTNPSLQDGVSEEETLKAKTIFK